MRLLAKTDTVSSNDSDALGLPFADILTFVLGHEGKYLQKQVSNERAE